MESYNEWLPIRDEVNAAVKESTSAITTANERHRRPAVLKYFCFVDGCGLPGARLEVLARSIPPCVWQNC